MSIDDIQDMRSLIEDQANRVFADLCTREVVDAAERGEWPAKLWNTLTENGLTLAAVPDDLGGGGASLGDGFALLKLAGRYSAPLPLAETFMAGTILAGAGRAVPNEPLTVAPFHAGENLSIEHQGGGWILSGTTRRVPWGSQVRHILVVAPSREGLMGALVRPESGTITRGTNLAGEPRDDLHFDMVVVGPNDVVVLDGAVNLDSLLRLGALTRAVMMAGALDSVLEMSIRYANERKQFGRPIGNFQAIQQQLAVVAGQTATSAKVADDAVRALEADGSAEIEIAVAKARAGEAAGIAAEIAHQVHAAMGFTHEHPLHQRTRRLWSWRDEYGAEPYWQGLLGRKIAHNGPDSLWAFITQT